MIVKMVDSGDSYYYVIKNGKVIGDVWKDGRQWIAHPSVNGVIRPTFARSTHSTRSGAVSRLVSES